MTHNLTLGFKSLVLTISKSRFRSPPSHSSTVAAGGLLIKLEEDEKNREGAALSLGRCPVAALTRVLMVNPQPHTCAVLYLGCVELFELRKHL
jgi:hypothetical protein